MEAGLRSGFHRIRMLCSLCPPASLFPPPRLTPKLSSYYPPKQPVPGPFPAADGSEKSLWCAHYLRLLSGGGTERMPPDDGFALDLFRAMGMIRLHRGFDPVRRYIDSRYAEAQRLSLTVRGPNTLFLFQELTRSILSAEE